MARPRKHVETLEVLRLRLAGFSWPYIASQMCLGLGTVYRAYRTAIEALQPFQNPKAVGIRRGRHSETDHHAAHDRYGVSAKSARTAEESDQFERLSSTRRVNAEEPIEAVLQQH